MFSRVTSILKTRKNCVKCGACLHKNVPEPWYGTSWAQVQERSIFVDFIGCLKAIFTVTVLKINKANLKSLQLLQVTRDFNRDHKTISRPGRKFPPKKPQNGSVNDLPRTPKRRVNARQQDRYIRLTHLRERNLLHTPQLEDMGITK